MAPTEQAYQESPDIKILQYLSEVNPYSDRKSEMKRSKYWIQKNTGLAKQTVYDRIKKLKRDGIINEKIGGRSRTGQRIKLYYLAFVRAQPILLNERLKELKETGADIDAWISAYFRSSFVVILSFIRTAFLMTLGIGGSITQWGDNSHGDDAYLKSKLFLKDKKEDEAHKALDSWIDSQSRYLMHELLQFLYLPDPRTGEPLYHNKSIWRELERLRFLSIDYSWMDDFRLVQFGVLDRKEHESIRKEKDEWMRKNFAIFYPRERR